MKKTLSVSIVVISLTLSGCSTINNFFGGMFSGNDHTPVRGDEKILQAHVQQCDTGKVAEDCITAGSMYELRGGDNYRLAMDFYQKGLALHSPDAYQAIGHLFENGYGVTQSYADARKWYQQGADAGDGNAMLYLSNMYRYGYGVSKDRRKAFEYARMGCKKGNILACAAQKQLLRPAAKK